MIREEYRRAKRELKPGGRCYLQTKAGLEKHNAQIFKIAKDQFAFTDGSAYHYREVYCLIDTSATFCENQIKQENP